MRWQKRGKGAGASHEQVRGQHGTPAGSGRAGLGAGGGGRRFTGQVGAAFPQRDVVRADFVRCGRASHGVAGRRDGNEEAEKDGGGFHGGATLATRVPTEIERWKRLEGSC
jgi:hypothetical protein